MAKSWSTLLSRFDAYERKARLYPAFLSILSVVIFVLSLRLDDETWLTKLILSTGLGGVLMVGLAQFSSAAGNRFGDRFWEDKGGLPTNRWLQHESVEQSFAQKQQWYAAIRSLTGLNLGISNLSPTEQAALINDALRQLRAQFRGKAAAKMLDLHNQEYGFARNLAGLRWILLPFSLIGFIGCGVAWTLGKGSPWGTLFNFVYLVFGCSMFVWLPSYVERAAIRYAESFFSTLLNISGKLRKDTTTVTNPVSSSKTKYHD